VTCVSHKKKLNLSNLTVLVTRDRNEWLSTPVNASGLAPPHLKTEYYNIIHGHICALSQRWHEDTSSFHLPIGEMTVTLDDVACLLDISINERLIEEEEISHDQGIELLQEELCFIEVEATIEVKKQCGGYVSYTKLKRYYERLLNRCNQLQELVDKEEAEEQSSVRTACIKVFLLLLLGYTIFVGKNNTSVNLLWLLALQDLDRLGDWS
jgi:hypothetical protein